MSGSASNPKLVAPHDTTADAKPARRVFNAEFKARILDECDATTEPGGVVALLRREGLYSSHLVDWRRARALEGVAGLQPKRPGPPPTDPAKRAYEQELERLRRENATLQDRLRRAEIIMEAQKKLSAVLATLGESMKGIGE